MGRASLDRQRVLERRPVGRPGLGAHVRRPQAVRADDRAAGVRADGLPRGQVRDERPPEHQGAGDGEVVQRGRDQPQEPEDGHPLQAVLRREAAVPHPEQHEHHRRLQEQGRRREERLHGDRCGRQVRRPDAHLGEEVQPQHGQVGNGRSRDGDSG